MQVLLSIPRGGLGQERERLGKVLKKTSLLTCLWEEFPATGGAWGSHLSLSDPCSASWHEADTAAYARVFCGGVSLARFQDFCEKPQGCWLEQMW